MRQQTYTQLIRRCGSSIDCRASGDAPPAGEIRPMAVRWADSGRCSLGRPFRLRAAGAMAVAMLIGLAALASPVVAATVYVSPTGADANDGKSWATAKKTVAAGLKAAVGGDQVWVAAGTYVERVTLKSSVALYGGFAGSETPDFDLSQRNFAAYPAILDGDKKGSVVSMPSGATPGTRIDGFTIRNGKAAGGGGIYCPSSASVGIANNTITSNTAGDGSGGFGGGIYCQSSSAVITNNRILGNTAGGSSSGKGGGIYCTGSSPMIANNTITGNAAIGGSSNSGGGIFCANSSAAISNNTVAGNSASTGGGISCEGPASPVISNNTITANNAGSGGGVYCSYSSPAISNNIVAHNSSGLFATGGTPTSSSNCVYNPAGANYSGLNAGSGDISVEPQLVAAGYGRTHLATHSPCIDAGLDSVVQSGWVDLDGEARIQGSHVDIGADESNGTEPTPFTPVIVRVKPSGNDANDGSSWNLAKQTVQAGIEAAALAGGGDVWVAAGTYRQRIDLRAWVYVYGGFAGDEDGRQQRNWAAQVTILDGGAAGSVVTASCCGQATSMIDGFTIRNGNTATFPGGPGSGGGINCSSVITIANNRITGNASGTGGGIYSNSSSIITNNVIIGNVASSNGGGVFCASSFSPIVCNNTITGNQSASGGGIGCSSGSPVLANNIVAFNSSGLGNAGGTPKVNNNCVYNPDGANYTGLPLGADNISVDPQLLATGYGDVHLTAGSPCIDAGLDSVVQSGWADVDGEPRTQGSHVDIGADEFNGTTPSFALKVIRVSPSGNDAADGLTWDSAKRTVRAGIDAAAAAGGGEVWVMTGVYSERISLSACVYVYGGFGGDEQSRSQRDWVAHVTVLDGGGSGTVVMAASCGYALSTIDGFTIRNGSGSDAGGGIHCSSSMVISNNTVTGNKSSFGAGGGIWCTGSSFVVVSNNMISANSGGVFCVGPARLFNNRIVANIGTAIYCATSSLAILNNTIVGNNSDSMAAVYCYNVAPVLSNNIVAFNTVGLQKTGAGAPTLHNNCVYNPNGINYSGLTAGVDDISVDPLLVAAGYGEFHLSASSPCLDAGLDSAVPPGSVDMDGEPRIQGGHVDIGADEFNGTAPPFTPRVVRVTPSGNDANDGSSWTLAKRTVQAGIGAVSAAGSGDVWVAAGTYNELITLRAWAHVYGGFAGNEDSREQRDWAAYLTTIDGGAAGSVVTASSCGCALSTVDGFTIRNGAGTGSSILNRGGGIYCSYSSPTISNNTIVGNKAGSGGGIYCSYSSPVVSNNAIVGNTAETSGGGILCGDYSSPVVSRNRIAGNRGGGIRCAYYSSPVICCNTITTNSTGSYSGGGLYSDSYCNPAVFCNLIAGNGGGGVSCSSGSPKITNNTIVGNSESVGGGIICSGAALIANNIVAFNSSGIYKSAGTTPTLRNNCVYNPDGANYVNLNPGSDDKSFDPGLVDQGFGEFHLRSDSLCIDAGLDTLAQQGWRDIDGESRIQGSHVDIGADEFNGTASPFTPRVVRVGPSGHDANDGSTWALAKRTVQAGIDAAADAGGGEVWAAAGTYNERITLKTWVYLYGGFMAGESNRDQRNWVTHATILDGGAGGSVVTASAPGYRFSVIDGFTIRNGSGTVDSNVTTHTLGGGIYCIASSPTVSNNTISGNAVSASGGGIYCTGSSSFPVVRNNRITGNSGGGIECNGCLTVISDNTITGNTDGGGIRCLSCSPPIYDNVIAGNIASRGGGIYCDSYSSPSVVSHTVCILSSTARARRTLSRIASALAVQVNAFGA